MVWIFCSLMCLVDAEINYSLELYGADSLCFEHGSAWTVQHCDKTYPVEHWGSGCYQVLIALISVIIIIVDG